MRVRFEIAIHRKVARRLRLATARRDLTVQRYVLDAIEERLRTDSDGTDSVMTARTDPALADLWDNPRDAAYDRL